MCLMKIEALQNIQKFCFGHEELSRALEISQASARVAASRYVKQGLLVRIKRNLYMRREVWNRAGREEKFRVANLAQVPSYLSLMTALDYHDVTTQVQRDFYESVALQRSKEIQIDSTIFRYTKIKKTLYFGFGREKGVFIASPEKALLDAFYLMSYGRYSFDMDSIETDRLDIDHLRALSKPFPSSTKSLIHSYGYT